MPNYIPHSDDEIQQMLSFIGLNNVDELFNMIPDALKVKGELNLGRAMSEPDIAKTFRSFAKRNSSVEDLVCFAGGGSYDHDIAAVTSSVGSRSEFVTSYTPYQPEVSQGVLQALFEFQTLISRISGLEVSNASLYDGASACVEAANLTTAATGRSGIWLSGGLNPNWAQVVRTFASGSGQEISKTTLSNGKTNWDSLKGSEPPAALLVQYPNYLGIIEDLKLARQVADSLGAMLIVAYDPIAMSILESPGKYADVAVAEGQSLGVPLSFGGPYLGLFSVKKDLVRRLPGRLIGETVDVESKKGYVSTLRAREQDIRRERASSNVCTNQTLMAIAAAIQMSWLGTGGIRQAATMTAKAAYYCQQLAIQIPGVKMVSDSAFYKEFALNLPISAEVAVERLLEEGFLAGIALSQGFEDTEFEDSLLICVTEKRTRQEIESFIASLEKVVA